MNASASRSPFSDLSVVLGTLRVAVGAWGGRGWLSTALTLVLWRLVGRTCGDMERLIVRIQAGKLWRRGPRRTAEVLVVAVDCGVRGGAARVWPGRFGWLVRAASWQAAGYGSQLRHILVQPEMVELLKAAPQAARILRPVCRMLAIEASVLRPGVVAVVAPLKVAAAVTKRVRKPRVPVDWGRIPLPRGVLAAARRQGFGKVPRD